MRTPQPQRRRRPQRSSGGSLSNPRGVAIIMVLTAIAIFTAVVIDFSYSSRVELDLAANARDEVRAYFLARSAVNFSRLILHFQKQLDQTMGAMGTQLKGITDALTKATGSTDGKDGAGGLNPGAMPGMGGLNLRLWELVPIDSGMIQMFLGGAGVTGGGDKLGDLDHPAAPPKGDAPGFGEVPGAANGKGQVKSFGDFSGSFHAEVDDEGKKFNVAWLDGTPRIAQMALARGLLMLGDKRYEWLFDEEDAHHVRTTAKDLLTAIKDYIDADAVTSVLNPQDPVNPFSQGFADEGSAYSRYTPSYKTKNAPMDSLDELYLVDGMSDRIMAAFKDRFTVFPDKNRAININTDDPFMQLINIYMAAANPNDPMLQNPAVIQGILRDIAMAKMFTGIGITLTQFLAILQGNKVVVDRTLQASAGNNPKLTDKTDTFTIHAVGEVGKVRKRLTAVVHTDPGLGQLVYWREE